MAGQTKLPLEYVLQHSAVISRGLARFPPYCIRHTALTRFARSGCDPFTLKRIAGHSTITITQKYCHPQAEAVEMAFSRLLDRHNSGHTGETTLPRLASEMYLTAGATEG